QRTSGALYLLQWKTVAGARPLDVLFDEVRVSWHECAYQWLAQRALGAEFAGTLLGAWRKLSARQQRAEDSFVLVPLSRTQHEVDAAVGEVMSLANSISENTEVRHAHHMMPNRRSCVSYNYRCQYF